LIGIQIVFYQAWEGGEMLETIKTVIYKVAIYIRLSKEDVDKGFDESESITNQKSLLTEYVKNLVLNNKYINNTF